MAIFSSDDFTDTDGTTLQTHTPSGGGSWSRVLGTRDLECRTNRIKRLAAGGSSTGAVVYIHDGTPASAEYDVQANYHQASDINNPCGVTARVTASGPDYYEVLYSAGTDTLTINKVVAGTQTQLGTTTLSLSNGDAPLIKFECRDATKKVYVDGVEETNLTNSDNAITAAGNAGVRFPIGTQTNGTGIQLDNFQAADPVVVTDLPHDLAHTPQHQALMAM